MQNKNPDEVLAGVFPVLATPFTDDGRIDQDAFGRIIALNLAAGVDGIVYPANASEFETLSFDERRELLARTFEFASERVPVIVGASAANARESVRAASAAARLGARAIIVMPPAKLKGNRSALVDLLASVSAVGLPIILQNAPHPLGPGLTCDEVVHLAAAVPRIAYVKEETLPSGGAISKIRANAPATIRGIFGGAGGRHLMNELPRGTLGSMPSCEAPEIHLMILRAYRDKGEVAARAIFDRILPLLNFVSVFRAAAVKEALRQRGVIRCSGFRSQFSTALDECDRRELSQILDDVSDLLYATR